MTCGSLSTCDPDSLERFFAALRSLAAGPAAGHAVVGRLHPHAAHAITTRRRAAQPIPTSTAHLLTRRRRGSNQGPRRRWVRVQSELRMCSPWCRGTPIYPAGRPGCSGALFRPWSGDAHHFALDGTWTALSPGLDTSTQTSTQTSTLPRHKPRHYPRHPRHPSTAKISDYTCVTCQARHTSRPSTPRQASTGLDRPSTVDRGH